MDMWVGMEMINLFICQAWQCNSLLADEGCHGALNKSFLHTSKSGSTVIKVSMSTMPTRIIT
eukprot:5679619-Amphidinium_carterae.1